MAGTPGTVTQTQQSQITRVITAAGLATLMGAVGETVDAVYVQADPAGTGTILITLHSH